MTEKNCDNCVKYIKNIKSLADENYRLQRLVEFVNAELTDKAELIEEIKQQLSEIHTDEKKAKDIVFKLLAKIVK